MDARLFDSAFRGDVNTLQELIVEDPLVLHAVTVTTSNTPLHVAALLGHTQFAMKVMQNYPGLADELNQQGLSPIHVASAKGHLEIVKGMLVLRPDLTLIEDKDGNIPLHTAAIRGRREILSQLFTTVSANELTSSRETVLHLAVKHNRYEALELLIQLANQYQIGNELFNAVDAGGNTIFHLACAGKKSKMVKLLSRNNVDVNAVNSEGLTALDLAVRATTGSNDEDEIQEIIRSVGAELTERVERLEQSIATKQQRRREKFVGSLKNGIVILAGIFASLSFEVGMNPPGGVWQEWASSNATKSATAAADGNNDTDPNSWSNSLFLGLFELASVSEGDSHKPGLSISWELGKKQFLNFILCNSLCFFLSIATIVVVALTEIFLWDWQSTSLLLVPMMCILLLIAAAEFVFGVAMVTDTSVANVFPLRALILVVILLNIIWQIAWICQCILKRLRRLRRNEEGSGA
ncbi:PREDICTED: ankyrin repeat-containing protein At2g01680-like isoform X2 [Populus euphratica]|uniref:Ankyrin repeat-containing protein At2g01680-like isoform X2 n=1 Tax=Populus euphratica TaxID=75702 RepID=A0AAJ6TV27_POPEU|nr:PREDICTED: ankyrin repeat-containing protein At2g01680-like isoform X2 [Populus euphratica]